MRSYPMGDMRDRCHEAQSHCEGETCTTSCFIRFRDASGEEMAPWLTKIFRPIKRKYKSKLHKKMHKLEKAYDKALGKPLLRAHLLKQATALANKIAELKT